MHSLRVPEGSRRLLTCEVLGVGKVGRIHAGFSTQLNVLGLRVKAAASDLTELVDFDLRLQGCSGLPLSHR